MPHSFPTRRSSDLKASARRRCASRRIEVLPMPDCPVSTMQVGRSSGSSCATSTIVSTAFRASSKSIQKEGASDGAVAAALMRSEEHTSELQSLMRSSYAVFCLQQQTTTATEDHTEHTTHTN